MVPYQTVNNNQKCNLSVFMVTEIMAFSAYRKEQQLFSKILSTFKMTLKGYDFLGGENRAEK